MQQVWNTASYHHSPSAMHQPQPELELQMPKRTVHDSNSPIRLAIMNTERTANEDGVQESASLLATGSGSVDTTSPRRIRLVWCTFTQWEATCWWGCIMVLVTPVPYISPLFPPTLDTHIHTYTHARTHPHTPKHPHTNTQAPQCCYRVAHPCWWYRWFFVWV